MGIGMAVYGLVILIACGVGVWATAHDYFQMMKEARNEHDSYWR